jgi:hypothetical protein
MTSYCASFTSIREQMVRGEMLLLLALDDFRIHLLLKCLLDEFRLPYTPTVSPESVPHNFFVFRGFLTMQLELRHGHVY